MSSEKKTNVFLCDFNVRQTTKNAYTIQKQCQIKTMAVTKRKKNETKRECNF